MVQTAALPYNTMSSGHYSSYLMGYPPQSAPGFYSDSNIPRSYARRDSSSSQAYSRSSWGQQQQQQPQQSQQSISTSSTSSSQSLPPLSEALHKIFPGQASAQQTTQLQQSRVVQQSEASSMAIQAQQAYQAQQVASAYQQGMQYGDVNGQYVITEAAYTSSSAPQVAQQIVSQASTTNSMVSTSGLPPIVPTNAGPDVSSGMMVSNSSSRHSRQGSAQMLSLNTSILPVTQDPSTGSPMTVTPIQSTSALQYPSYPPSLHHPQMLSNPATAVYGPLGHRRNHSTSSSVSTSSTHHDDESSPSGEPQKVFSFVALPGVNTKKRPRRKYEEIDRHYTCNYLGCAKSYGTLNHLNAHVQMQKHGQKRHPAEFKELRKQWRRQKREEAIKKASEESVNQQQH